jgi:hypothetical protein
MGKSPVRDTTTSLAYPTTPNNTQGRSPPPPAAHNTHNDTRTPDRDTNPHALVPPARPRQIPLCIHRGHHQRREGAQILHHQRAPPLPLPLPCCCCCSRGGGGPLLARFLGGPILVGVSLPCVWLWVGGWGWGESRCEWIGRAFFSRPELSPSITNQPTGSQNHTDKKGGTHRRSRGRG